jgi:hypothetical protein
LVELLRDPRYLAPLGVLIVVILIASLLGRGDSHAQSQAPAGQPHATGPVDPTPDTAAIDARRMSDLTRGRDALEDYLGRYGSFPNTRNTLTTLCAQPSDAGCELKNVSHDLSFSDGDAVYWYASDGARFVLIATALTAQDTGDCPVGLPAELAAAPVICVRGER